MPIRVAKKAFTNFCDIIGMPFKKIDLKIYAFLSFPDTDVGELYFYDIVL